MTSKSCDPIKIININLSKNNIQSYKLSSSASLCYSNLKVEGKRIIIPDSVPLIGTVITNKGKTITIYHFYRSSIPTRSIKMHVPVTKTLPGKIKGCISYTDSFLVEQDLTHFQFLLIGAGGKGGNGGIGGDGFGGAGGNGGGGGGGGSSGAPGKAGAINHVIIGDVLAGTTVSYRFGANCGDRSTTLTLTPLKGPSNTYSASGGEDGINGNNGSAATGNNGAAGGSVKDGFSGGDGGDGLFLSTLTGPNDGSRGGGPNGGGGGEAQKFGGGGGGGGGGAGGASGQIINYKEGVFTYNTTQVPTFGGGVGGHGYGSDGGLGGSPSGTVFSTPPGCGGNGGAGGGGGGGGGDDYAGGGGGPGSAGFLGGNGTILLYYVKKINVLP